MKKILILALAVLSLASCGRTKTISKHEGDKRSFDAWVHVQKESHPEYLWQQTELGSMILEDDPGTGSSITGDEDTVYVRINYIYRRLDGTIINNSYERIAQQLGTYKETSYYGPALYYTGGIYAGFEEILKGMKDGGHRKAAIPGWLLTYARYDSPEKYLNDSTSTSPGVFDLELVEHFRDVKKWELDSIARYRMRNFPSQTGTDLAKAVADSSGAHGFYYIRRSNPSAWETLKDTTVYINYTGRLLNGHIFDTTIRDSAMVHGIYSSSRTYSPVAVKIGSSWSGVKLGSGESSVVDGFARTISKMGPFEKGTGIFWSTLGYGTSGSGSAIPAYSPLRFDIELVRKPD